MSFKDGRIGVGKDPIFPLDISGSARIDGDLVLGGRFSDSQGNPILLGGGSGTTSTPDQNQDGLPSWNGGTITTQGLGVFKGRLDTAKDNILIIGNNSWNANTTGTGNTTLGYAAGYSLTSGTKNVLIGKDAGFQLSSANYNTFVGYEAGMNSNQSQNTFVGYEAGKANTNGYENTFVGTFCGKNNTTAINGVFVGRCAGFSNTSGNYNTFIGMNAGRMNTTGINNCCLGFEAGRDITTGSRNIAIGSHAMHDNVGNDGYMIAIGPSAMQNYGSRVANTATNRYCIAIGYQAMMGLNGSSGGENNVAIGNQALKQITSGNYNVCLGNKSGYSITTAANIIAIGDNAFSKVTTSGNSVAIGRYAGYGCTGGQNICIGYNVAYNTSSNTGHNNVLMGQTTSYSLTSGYENVCIGREVAYYLTTGIRNVFMGSYAGKASSSAKNTGNYNVGIGYNTLRFVSSGGENVCIGYQAGKDITTGLRNVCIGRAAGENITTANYNVAIGYNSLITSTTAYSNVSIGPSSGYKLTTGFENVYIGNGAGYNSTTSSQNVFIGMNAGMGNTTGYENVHIGVRCGESGNGQHNTYIGARAGQAASSGNYNTYIGRYAGRTATGSSNTLIGNYAGANIGSSYDNVMVGFQTGYQATGNNNIFMGYNCGSMVSSGSDNVAVGNQCLSINTCTGSYNTVFGRYAGYRISNGTENCCFGHQSGQNISGGGYNTFLGKGSGYQNNTGSWNIAIGRNSNYYGTVGNNNISIGQHAGTNDGANEGDYNFYINSQVGYYGNSSYIYGYTKMTEDPFIIFNCDVGIGTTSPYTPLDVATSRTLSDADVDQYWDRGTNDGFYLSMSYVGHSGGPVDNGHFKYGDLDVETASDRPVNLSKMSAHFYDYIYCSNGGLLVSSDERIKKGITEINDNLALTMVRDISCCTYYYIDDIGRQKQPTIGFIAQQVNTVFPQAVTLTKRIIPNIMRRINDFSWVSDNSNNTHKLISDLQDVSGVLYRFYVSNNVNEREKRVEHIGNSDNTFTFENKWEHIFCYGYEVPDFHALDKQKLYALNFSATQELDRKIIALEKENYDQNVKILDLYKENESLKARLAKIESFLGL